MLQYINTMIHICYFENFRKILIPVYAIQRDEEYYENPNEFKPERFSPEEIQKRDSVKWLPFGDGMLKNTFVVILSKLVRSNKSENFLGLRNCVGLRFGMMQTRIGFVTLVKNFEITLGSKTKVPITYDPSSFILSSKFTIYLKLKPIK